MLSARYKLDAKQPPPGEGEHRSWWRALCGHARCGQQLAWLILSEDARGAPYAVPIVPANLKPDKQGRWVTSHKMRRPFRSGLAETLVTASRTPQGDMLYHYRDASRDVRLPGMRGAPLPTLGVAYDDGQAPTKSLGMLGTNAGWVDWSIVMICPRCGAESRLDYVDLEKEVARQQGVCS